MNIWLAVFLGGGIGSMLRYGITRLVLASDVRAAFPWATVTANVLGTALLALLVLRWQHHFEGREPLKAFLAIGLCGGFSTFSTFSMENFMLLRQGLYLEAVVNIIVSVVVGIALFYLIAKHT